MRVSNTLRQQGIIVSSELGQLLEYYDGQQPHTGRYCDGRTPLQTFAEIKSLAKQKEVDVLYFGKLQENEPPDSFLTG